MDPNFNGGQCTAKEDISFANLEYLIGQKKDAEVIRVLNQTPFLLNIVDISAQTLLHVATRHKNLVIMEHLIKVGCDIEAKTNTGMTPLMIAANTYCKNDDPRPVEMLLSYDADVFSSNLNGESALNIYLYSLNFGYLPVIEAFFEKAKSKNNDDLFDILTKGKCYLPSLVHFRNIELTKMLLDKREVLEHYDDYSDMICYVMTICINHNYEEILRVLLHDGIFQDTECGKLDFLSFFNCAVSYYQIKEYQLKNILEMSVELLVEPKFLNHNIIHGIDKIFLNSNEQPLRELLKTDLNTFVKKEFGYEPVAYIFGNSNPGIFKFIQKENFDLSLRGRHGETLLSIAFQNKVEDHIRYLLEKNLDPNMANNFGCTPIFFTFIGRASINLNECVKLLLKYNVDIQVLKDSKTFVQYGRYTDEHETTFMTILIHLAILEACGTPINSSLVDFVNSHENLFKFHKKLIEQLEQMKSHKIHRSLTLFETFWKSYDFLSHCIRTMHPDTVKNLCSSVDNSLMEYNDYYINIIRERIEIAHKIYKTRNQAAIVIRNCIDQLQGNVVVIDKICTFLSYKHLHKIVYSSHEENCNECKLLNIACYQFVRENN